MAGKGIDFTINPTIDKKSIENDVKNASKSGAEKGVKEGAARGIKEGVQSQLPAAARALSGAFKNSGREIEKGAKSALDAASALNAAADNLSAAASKVKSHVSQTPTAQAPYKGAPRIAQDPFASVKPIKSGDIQSAMEMAAKELQALGKSAAKARKNIEQEYSGPITKGKYVPPEKQITARPKSNLPGQDVVGPSVFENLISSVKSGLVNIDKLLSQLPKSLQEPARKAAGATIKAESLNEERSELSRAIHDEATSSKEIAALKKKFIEVDAQQIAAEKEATALTKKFAESRERLIAAGDKLAVATEQAEVELKKATKPVLRKKRQPPAVQEPISEEPPPTGFRPVVTGARGRPRDEYRYPPDVIKQKQEYADKIKEVRASEQAAAKGGDISQEAKAKVRGEQLKGELKDLTAPYDEAYKAAVERAKAEKDAAKAAQKRARIISKGPPTEDVKGRSGRDEAAMMREAIAVRKMYSDSLSEHVLSSVNSLSRMAAADRKMAQLAEAAAKAREAGKGYSVEDLKRAVSGPPPGAPPPGAGPPPPPSPPGGAPPGGGPPDEPPGGWQSSISRMWAQITSTLSAEQVGKLDASAIFKATPYRELAGRHQKELAGGPSVKGPQEVEEAFKKFNSSTQERMESLVSNLRSLATIAEAPGVDPSSELRKAIKNIRRLSSKTEKGVKIEGGEEEVRAYEKELRNFVQGSFKKVVSSLINQNRELEKKIATAAAEGKKIDVNEFANQFAENIREIARIYDIIEQSGEKFNINIQRAAKGGKGFAPPSPLPEAQFRFQDYAGRGAQKELGGLGLDLANKSAQAAKNFDTMEDMAERIRAALVPIASKLGPSSLEFRKNLTGVVERLKRESTTGIIDRAEVERTIKILENYIKQVEKLRMGELGLGAGGKTVIPSVYGRVAGGSEAEFLRQVELQKRQFARGGGTGTRTEQFEFVDQSGAVRKMQVSYKRLAGSMDQVAVSAKSMNRAMDVRGQLGLAFRRVALWGTAAGLTYGAISAFRDAIGVMVEAESGVVSLSKVMEEADFGMKEFTNTVNTFVGTVTQEFAASMREAYDVMRIFAQQGKNMADTMELTRASFLGANISVLTQKEVAEALTAATKQFNIEASNSQSILDAWNEVSNRNAVTMKTLADATKKAGAAAKVVGVEFEQFIGIVTAISEATRQPGKEVGTSLRFIFQRTLRPESQRSLAKVGVSTTDLKGNFKGFIPILTELADNWDNLSKAQKLSIAQALGGARQYNVFLALMENFDTAVKASEEAVNSQGSAQRENNKYMQTAEARMKKAKAAVHALYVSIGSTLLPVIKTTSDVVGKLAKSFQEIPGWMKGATAAFLAFAVAGSRVAQSLDYVLMSAGTSTAGAGIGSLLGGALIGRGKTAEQIAALPIEKQAAAGAGGLAGKRVTDIGYLGLAGLGVGKSDIASGLKEQGLQLKKLDTSWDAMKKSAAAGTIGQTKWIDANTAKMSKLTAVVKGYGVAAEGSSNVSRLGMQALNSPISMAIALLAQLTKGIVGFGVKALFLIPQMVAAVTGLGKAFLATRKAAILAKIQVLGLFGTAALAVGLGVAIYYGVKAFASLGKASRKTHQQVAKDFESEIATSQKRLRLVGSELASLKRIESQRRKLQKLGEQAPEERFRAIDQGEYKSPLVAALRYSELQQKAGASIAKIDPSAIQSMDEYGRVTLNTSKSMLGLADAAVAAQAQLVAFYKTKVASAAAGQAADAFKKLKNAVEEYTSILPALTAGSNIFGQQAKYSKGVEKMGINLIKAQQSLASYMKVVKDTLSGLPKATPIESFVAALADTDIFDAFSREAKKVSTVLLEQGKAAATAGDLMNKMFLKSKGFKGIGITGEATKELYLQKGVARRTIDELYKELTDGTKRLSGLELITFGPNGPFGLTQARVFMDNAGRYMIQGVNKFGVGITKSLREVKDKLGKESGTLVFDTSSLVQQFNTSIAKARKALAGAGAGLIKFPAQVDLGVRLRFQLPDLDYLQSSGKAVADMITRVTVAQEGYASKLEDFKKGFKENASGLRAIDQINQLNESARRVAQSAFILNLSNEIGKLGKAAEAAAYQMKAANVQDEVAQQFAALTTSAKGFSEDLTFKLPKLQSQLSPTERVSQANPELARSIRASDRAFELVKQQAKTFAVATKVDLPQMFAESGVADVSRFFDKADQERRSTAEALKRYGGNKQWAEAGKDIGKVESAVKDQTKVLGEKLDVLAGKEPKGEREAKPELQYATDAISKLMGGLAEKAHRDAIGESGRVLEDAFKKIENMQKRDRDVLFKQLRGDAAGAKSAGLASPSARKLFIDAAKKARAEGRSFTAEDAAKIQKQLLEGLHRAITSSMKAVYTDTREDDPSSRGYLSTAIGWFSKDVGRGFEESVWKPFRRVFGEEYGTKERQRVGVGKELLPELLAQQKALQGTSIDELRKVGQQVLESAKPGFAKPSRPTEGMEIIKAAREDAANSIKHYADTTSTLIAAVQKEIQTRKENLAAIGLAASVTKEFAANVENSLRGLLSFGKQLKVLGPLTAPLVGAGAGIPQGRIDIGKTPGELTAYERLFNKFPDMVGNLTRQEQIRQKALSESAGIYQQLTSSQRKLAEVQKNVNDPAQRSRLARLGERGTQIWNAFRSSLERTNQQMRPLLSSFAELQRLEQVAKNIEDIVSALKKAEDLEFDTTSIDKALGRHPLSPTAGVYGQPAGLDKFQRRMYELEQKRRTGQVGFGEFDQERKKIEFEKGEALIQYKQSKENAKLQQEVDAAKRAMGILWDAQYQGIDGLQPLIDTIKSELSTAGESYNVGGQQYFKGIPSLQDLQKEISKVQEQKRAQNFKQQRDIVMGETERLLAQIHDLLKEQDKAVKEAGKEAEGEGGVKGLNKTIQGFIEKFKTAVKAVAADLAAKEKLYGDALGGKGEQAEKLGELNTKFAETMQQVGESFKAGTDDYKVAVGVFMAAAEKLSKAATSTAVTSAGKKVLASADKSPGGFSGGFIVPGYAEGGTITGSVRGKSGRDNIRGQVPVGGYVVRQPAVDSVGLSNLNKMEAAHGGTGSGKTMAADMTNREFIFSPGAVNSIGVGALNKLNRTGKIPGFADGGSVGGFKRNYVLDTYSKTDQEKSDIYISDKRVRKAMTMEGLMAMKAITSNKKLSEEERLAQLEKVYTDPKYREEIIESAKKRNAELLAEQLGGGGGYIKVGDKYYAYGRANLVDEGRKSRSRLTAFKKQYEEFKKGNVSRKDMQELAYGISPSKLKETKDSILVKALRSGLTPKEYTNRIKETTTVRKGQDKMPTMLEEAREYQNIRSKVAFADFLRGTRIGGEVRKESILTSMSSFLRASGKHDRIRAYRDFLLTQKAGSQELAEKRANVASVLALLSKDGNVPGLGNSWQSDEMQKVASVGGVKKVTPTISFGGERVPLAVWTNPKTAKQFLVDARRIDKSGNYLEDLTQDDEGNVYYSGFKIPIGEATSNIFESGKGGKATNVFDVGRVFLERSGGTKAVGVGEGVGVGTVNVRKTLENFKRTGELSYTSKDARNLDLPDYTKREQLERAGLKGPTARFFGSILYNLVHVPKGLAKAAYHGSKFALKAQFYPGGVSDKDATEMYENTLLGFTKGTAETLANLGILDAPKYGIEAKRTSALYGLVGRRARSLRGKKDIGAYEATAEGLGDTVTDAGLALIPAVGKLGKLAKKVKSLKAASVSKYKIYRATRGVPKGGQLELDFGKQVTKPAQIPPKMDPKVTSSVSKQIDVLQDIRNSDSLRLLSSSRPTLYRKAVQLISNKSEKLAKALTPTRRLKKEALMAYELGIDPRSAAVGRGPLARRLRKKIANAQKEAVGPGDVSKRALFELTPDFKGKAAILDDLRSVNPYKRIRAEFRLRRALREMEGQPILTKARTLRTNRLEALERTRDLRGPFAKLRDFFVNRFGKRKPGAQTEFDFNKPVVSTAVPKASAEQLGFGFDKSVLGKEVRGFHAFERIDISDLLPSRNQQRLLDIAKDVGSRGFGIKPSKSLSFDYPIAARETKSAATLAKEAAHAARPAAKLVDDLVKKVIPESKKAFDIKEAVARVMESGRPFSLEDLIGRQAGEFGVASRVYGSTTKKGIRSISSRIRSGEFNPSSMGNVQKQALIESLESEARKAAWWHDYFKSQPGANMGLVNGFMKEAAYYEKLVDRFKSGKKIRYDFEGGNLRDLYEANIENISKRAETARNLELLRQGNPYAEGPGVRGEVAAGDTLLRVEELPTLFASGGFVSGPGSGKSDSVPAMLSNGEYVINADAARRLGIGFLDGLNSGRVGKFQRGGLVGDSTFAGFSAGVMQLIPVIKELALTMSSATRGAKQLSQDELLARRGKVEGIVGPSQSALLTRRGKLEGIDSPSQAELLAYRGKLSDAPTEEDLLARRGKMSGDSAELVGMFEKIGGAINKILTYAQKELVPADTGKLPPVNTRIAKRGVEPTGPGSGDVIPFESPSKSGGPQSAGVSDALASAAESIKSAIAEALKSATIAISAESIKSVGDAVKQGVQDGAGSIGEAVRSASPSSGEGTTGLGAAVRPGAFEALEGRVEILGEKITEFGYLRNSDQTDLNERLSGISDDTSRVLRDELNPKIATNGESIDRVNHDVKTLQALVHSALARIGSL